ncbi:MAG: hypothetical protein FWD46_04850 [Cystobacterineae bacterium]|nr:hypothetical protein [Cystobacterineae bacterium]
MKTDFLKNYRTQLALLQKPLQEPVKNPVNASVQNTLKTPDVFDAAQIQSKKTLLETLKPAAPLPASTPVKKKKKSFWQKLKDAFKKVGNAFKKAFNAVGNFFKNIWNSIGKFFKAIGDLFSGRLVKELAAKVKKLIDDIKNATEKFKTFVRGLVNHVQNVMAGANKIRAWMDDIPSKIKTWIGNPDLAKKELSELGNDLDELDGNLSKLNSDLEELKKAGISIEVSMMDSKGNPVTIFNYEEFLNQCTAVMDSTSHLIESTRTLKDSIEKGIDDPLFILTNSDQLEEDLQQFDAAQKQFEEDWAQLQTTLDKLEKAGFNVKAFENLGK